MRDFAEDARRRRQKSWPPTLSSPYTAGVLHRCLALASGIFVAHSQAHATETRASVVLHYSALAACPDEQSFRRKVATRLGYDPFVADAPRNVTVDLVPNGTRLRARARVQTPGKPDAERALDDSVEHCEALADALAASVAMAVDPLRALAAPATNPIAERVQNPSIPVEAPAPRVIIVHDAPPPKPGPPVRFFAQAAITAGFGVLPGEGYNAEAGFGAQYTDFSLTAEGRVSQQWGTETLLSGYRIDATALSAALVPCAHYGMLVACAVGRVGAMQGRSPDVTTPSLGSTQLASLSARAELALPLSQAFAWRVLGEAGLPVVRTSFVVNGRQVWTAPSGQFALGTGLRVTF